MKGFAQIPAGAKGSCTNTFDFTGITGQVGYTIDLPGERDGPFDLVAAPDMMSWSPCGGSAAIMNMNTQCTISPTQSHGLIAVSYSTPQRRAEYALIGNRLIVSTARLQSMSPLTGARVLVDGSRGLTLYG